MAARLTEELAAFRPNQYANPANPRAHELTTGPELWRQTARRITHFVAGAGTCGTITGTARYLKARTRTSRSSPPTPRVGVLRRLGSALPRRRRRRGLLSGRVATELYDDVIAVSDEESFLTARRVSQAEGSSSAAPAGWWRRRSGSPAAPARRHRRRAQPRFRARLPVPGVRRRLDGQLRIRPSATPASGAVLETRGRWPGCSTSIPIRPSARRST